MIKKIRDLRLGKKGHTKVFTEAGLKARSEVAIKHNLTNNPMKNPEIAKKQAAMMKGKIRSPLTLFQKGNKYGKLQASSPGYKEKIRIPRIKSGITRSNLNHERRESK